MHRILATVLCAAFTVSAATESRAHGGGGGGGGGHNSGSYTYTYYYPGVAVPLVPPTKTGDYTNIHAVAVVSAVGQSLMLGRTGLLAAHSTIDTGDWHMDQSVEALTGKLLASRFTVKSVPHDSAELAKIPNGFMDTSSAKALQSYILALNAKDVDAIIVIRPDAETGTPPTPGLSLQIVDGSTHPREETNYEIDVVDAHTGAIVAHAFSRVAERQGVPVQFAAFNGASSLNLAPGQTPTAAQRDQLKRDFERDMAMAMRETLRALNLGIVLPEVGTRNIVAIPPAENPCRKLKRVMAISTLGDRVEVDYPGSLFTKRKDHLIPVADWDFDTTVEKLATGALDSCFQVVKAPVDRAKLASFVVTSDKSVLEKPMDGITPGSDVDLYIVFAKLRNDNADGISGLALWGGGNSDSGEALAEYAVTLIDAKTGKIIFMLQGVASPKFAFPVPGRQLAKTYIPNPGESFSPFQSANARTLFSDMMADSIAETLLRLQLTGKRIESAGADLAAVEPAEAGGQNAAAGAAPPAAPAAPAAKP
jgi:hypothetical protein